MSSFSELINFYSSFITEDTISGLLSNGTSVTDLSDLSHQSHYGHVSEHLKRFELCILSLTILSLVFILFGCKGFTRQIFAMKAIAGSLACVAQVLVSFDLITFKQIEMDFSSQVMYVF